MNKEIEVTLVSFSNIEKDGRLKELYKVCQALGTTQVIDRKNESIIKYFFKLIFKSKNCKYLVVDNRAVIPFTLLLLLLKKFQYIIQDCREMYFLEEQKTLKSKIGCIFEKKLIKSANIILVANKYRARIMKKYYSLKIEPIVFENIRKLEDIQKEINFENKYSNFFRGDSFKIISTSGYQNTDIENQLIKAVLEMKENIKLYFIGNNKPIDQNLMAKDNKKIYFINRVSLEELKYILKQVDIGYVGYEIINLNTKYCASGKIYEYLYEGLPILAYKNIPLKRFIEKYKIGVSGDNFNELINELESNYDKYKKNIERVKNKISELEKENILLVVQQIIQRII